VSEFWFYVLAGMTVAAASGVVMMRNPVHCALSLVVTLFLVAINYIALEAHLVAALQIIVYAGAVMVLFLFVIMLLNLQTDPNESPLNAVSAVAALAGVVLAVALGRVLYAYGTSVPAAELPENFGTTKALSGVLFREHLVAFELTSVLLLVAVVGAVVLAQRDKSEQGSDASP
jgi:NADH-quinone oxidoreductase subunit J